MGISNQRTGADRIKTATCLQDLVRRTNGHTNTGARRSVRNVLKSGKYYTVTDLVEITKASTTSVHKALKELPVDCDGSYPAYYSLRLPNE